MRGIHVQMAHFGHDDYTLNVPYGVRRHLKVEIMPKYQNILSSYYPIAAAAKGIRECEPLQCVLVCI
jgi:hypothetical protein